MCVCNSVKELQVCDKRQKIRREQGGFKLPTTIAGKCSHCTEIQHIPEEQSLE